MPVEGAEGFTAERITTTATKLPFIGRIVPRQTLNVHALLSMAHDGSDIYALPHFSIDTTTTSSWAHLRGRK